MDGAMRYVRFVLRLFDRFSRALDSILYVCVCVQFKEGHRAHGLYCLLAFEDPERPICDIVFFSWCFLIGRSRERYGEPVRLGNTVVMTVDMNARTVSFSKDGRDMGVAYQNLPCPLVCVLLSVSAMAEHVNVSRICVFFSSLPHPGQIPAASTYTRNDKYTIVEYRMR